MVCVSHHLPVDFRRALTLGHARCVLRRVCLAVLCYWVRSETGMGLGESLSVAAFTGNVSKVKRLLRQGAPPSWKDDDGNTPLHVATSRGHMQVVQQLVSAGADVNATDEDGMTPLIFAVTRGHVRMVQILVDAGADVKQKDTRLGWTALDWGVSLNSTQVIDYLAQVLRKHGNLKDPHMSAPSGMVEEVRPFTRVKFLPWPS